MSNVVCVLDVAWSPYVRVAAEVERRALGSVALVLIANTESRTTRIAPQSPALASAHVGRQAYVGRTARVAELSVDELLLLLGHGRNDLCLL